MKKYSKHFLTRMQQRAIDNLLVDLIMTVGEEVSDGHGCTLYSLSKRKVRNQMAAELRKKADKLEKEVGMYVVESAQGDLITLGYQQHKFYQNHRPVVGG